jgi:uncharacterized protein (DUF58 family)
MAQYPKYSGLGCGHLDLLDAALRKKLDALDLLSRRIVAGRLRGDRPTRRIGGGGGDSNELADFRDYSPGDDPRFVDWNAYARLDRLLLRLFTREEELPVHLLLDCSPSCDWGEPNKLLYIKRLAAALGYVALVNHHRITIHAMSHRSSESLRDRARIPRLLRFLSDLPVTSDQGENRFEDMCRKFISNGAPRGIGAGGGGGAGVCILLSDFLFRENLSDGFRLLHSAGHDLFCLQVLSPQEFEPETSASFKASGEVKLIDIEDRRTCPAKISPESLAEYKANLRNHNQRVQTEIKRYGGQFVTARTDLPVDRLVLDCLRRARLLA